MQIKKLSKASKYFLLFVTYCFSIACAEKSTAPTPAPFALFSFVSKGTLPPMEVTFTNKSVNADTYLWDFGDGTPTSTEANPKHTYTASGTFKVTLTATGKGGSTKAEQEIFVDKPISKVFVSKITVESVAAFRTGNVLWDSGTFGYPDIYLTLSGPLPATTEIYKQPNPLQYLDRIPSAYPLEHTLVDANNAPILTELVGFDKEFTAHVYDDDGTVKELMGSVTFKMADYITGANAYPLTVRKTNGTTTISLTLSWTK